MPIGAYNPWIQAHCTPEQAVRMASDAGADRILPVHHKNLSFERRTVRGASGAIPGKRFAIGQLAGRLAIPRC